MHELNCPHTPSLQAPAGVRGRCAGTIGPQGPIVSGYAPEGASQRLRAAGRR